MLYGILCQYGNFVDDTSYEQVNKFCYIWWMSASIGQTTAFSCKQLVMKYCMDDYNLDEKLFGKWQ